MTRLAGELQALVAGEMGAPTFDAAREPFLTALAHRDFNASHVVARYAVTGTVAAGEAFALETRSSAVSGYTELASPSTAGIEVPTPGSYHVRLRGGARSASTANPASLEIALAVDGVEVAGASGTRESADPSEVVPLEIEAEITVDGTLTVRNGSESEETAFGTLHVWRDWA